MKKTINVILCIAVLFIIFFGVKEFMPRPIAENGVEEVILVEANFNYGEENSKLTAVHFLPEKVVECLSSFKEQRIFKAKGGYAEKNVQMTFLLRTKSGLKRIIIGKETYCDTGNGKFYKILDEENFKKAIFDVCGYNEQ